MSGEKKGLSIGAAMKQRMDAEQTGPADDGRVQAPEVQPRPVTSAGDRAESEVLESFNTRLPRGLHRRLKVHTAREGLKIQAVVAQALEQYLEQSEKKES